MTAQIRPADAARDAAACAAIYRPFVRESWTSFELKAPDAAEMARRIDEARAHHGWFVAEDHAGRLLGYCYASQHRSRAAYRTSCDVAIYVAPVAARRGIGRALYTMLFDELRHRRYHAAFAGIALPNAASIGLHRAMGFGEVGTYREVGWKMGGWRDVSWWQLVL
ncbi:MAG: N-acetyltransferase family protein [Sphingomonadales bacterium]|nr:N-acetyltransferase family protein [Sphingomonadales bacterium]MBD3775314.1 N-acetyltransferase family protein [Paracoccaceae bacterium]